ncbi:alpha/beta hydrolase [Gordonia soli]|uniref:Putative hydrolase n=1 Tax=Gordonia soli NBRC 108243 TaxID=1223545 RepID=M0QKU1_9ACTN|nr:alpha/beta fold hydrolase [Gordonia soli]GAC68876.1 putative hydrolase [Gordonia soli NBRC 108243]
MRRPSRAPTRTIRGRLAVVVAISAVLVGGCAIGPDPGPDAVTGGGGGGEAAPSSSAPPPPPRLSAPRTDLNWLDCSDATTRRYDVPRPSGVRIQCATFESPIDPDRPEDDTVTVAATRVTAADTPADAAPLVLTAGTDLPSSRVAMLLAAGPGRSVLARHPIVAVDRRGIPESSELDCLTRAERTTMADNGLGFATQSQSDRIARLARAATSASDGCTETLTPHQLDFAVSFAASDLETLRKRWGVEHLGLIGVGEGSDVALAYASAYGGRSGRIILDTPTPFGANARDRANQQATGVQTALRTFTQRCSAAGDCPLGADGVATITDVVDKGRSGDLSGISDTQALAGITTAIAVAPDGPRGITDVAAMIAAADRGDVAALRRAAQAAEDLRTTDGQLVSRCNDVTGPVGQNEVPGLITAWSRQNPITGANSALGLLRCNGWASTTPVSPPNAFPVAPLILSGANDPINGGGGADALRPLLIRAGTEATTVGWDGIGYSVLARSDCAADIVGQYVDTAPLTGPTQRGCPS